MVIGDFEEDLAGKLGFPLLISWDWTAIQTGQQWDTTGNTLRDWIISNDARRLSEGRHKITDVPGVPFSFNVTKGGRLGFDGVRFVRHDPKDTTFNERLHDQLAGRHKKLAALGHHRREGKTTMLLLESHDLALMNAGMIIDALEAAFPTRPAEVDQVWFMHYVAPGTVNVHDLRTGGIWLYDLAANFSLHNPHGPQLAWPA